MLVDIVQTFDEQTFDRAGRRTAPRHERAEQERDVMSAMVMGPATPSLSSVPGFARQGTRTVDGGRPARARVGAPPAAARVEGGSAAHLRLTARGRAVLWILAAVVVSVVTLLGTRAAADGPVSAQEVVRHTVAPGETLWEIAESVAGPSDDVRDVVVDLVRLNELPDAGLMAGQVIVVPAS
jgi:hypothetical protein